MRANVQEKNLLTNTESGRASLSIVTITNYKNTKWVFDVWSLDILFITKRERKKLENRKKILKLHDVI